MDEVKNLVSQLKSASSKEAGDQIITEIKKRSLRFNLFAVNAEQLKNSSELRDKAIVQRDALEAATLFSAKYADIDAITRNFQQLEPFYTSFATVLPPTTDMPIVVAIYLLALLSCQPARIASFHNTLALHEDILPHPAIRTVSELERAVVEGALNRATARAGVVLAELPFAQPLLDTVAASARVKAVECMETAAGERGYPLSALCRVIDVNEAEAAALVGVRGWRVVDGMAVKEKEEKEEDDQDRAMVDALVQMAARLEHIV